MITSRYRTLVVATCIGMLLVLLAGALVTNTESGRGCGDDWPLCNGKFIPAYTLESMIEYSHRLISGIVGILVLAAFVMTLRRYKQREPLTYAGGALLFTVVQALLGAAAVLWPQTPPVMALHFGISLFAFACTLLLAVWAHRTSRGISVKPASPMPKSVYPRVVAVVLFCLVVIYLGAFIRHTDSSGGCIGWPLCNGAVIPELEGATLIVFLHRVAALLLAFAIAGMYLHIRRTSEALRNAAGWALGLVVAQVFSGALVSFTITNGDVFIFTSLLHNLIIAGLFGILLDIAIRARRYREGSAAD